MQLPASSPRGLRECDASGSLPRRGPICFRRQGRIPSFGIFSRSRSVKWQPISADRPENYYHMRRGWASVATTVFLSRAQDTVTRQMTTASPPAPHPAERATTYPRISRAFQPPQLFLPRSPLILFLHFFSPFPPIIQ